MFFSKILSKKPTLAKFFEKAYKIKVIIVFLILATLVLRHLSLDLTQIQFLSKMYQFKKNNLYLKNISQLMSLLPKMESIFFIVITLDKIEYEFKNRAVLEVPEQLIITTTNLLVYYLIIEVSYTRLLLITKLTFICIEFEVSGEISYIYDDLAKPGKEIKPS